MDQASNNYDLSECNGFEADFTDTLPSLQKCIIVELDVLETETSEDRLFGLYLYNQLQSR